MNKEKIIRNLQATINQLTCMKESLVEENIKNNKFEMTFDKFSFEKRVKYTVNIKIYETNIETKEYET
jgi:hypothetical protein